jgi:hypothetical protein
MLRDAFAANLALAGERFRNGRSGADGGRTGACLALAALIRYAQTTRPDVAADLLPAILLATKLADVEVGNVDRLFEPPPRRNGRPPPTLQRESLKQILAVTVAILIDGGWAKPDAENYVAGRLKKYGQDIAGPTIGNWRSHVDEHRPRGVGTPGRPDESGITIANPGKVDLYFQRWHLWRTLRSLHLIATKQPIWSAEDWVDAHVFNDALWAFFD